MSAKCSLRISELDFHSIPHTGLVLFSDGSRFNKGHVGEYASSPRTTGASPISIALRSFGNTTEYPMLRLRSCSASPRTPGVFNPPDRYGCSCVLGQPSRRSHSYLPPCFSFCSVVFLCFLINAANYCCTPFSDSFPMVSGTLVF